MEAWTKLGAAVGIAREELWSLKGVVPGVRFACDAYVEFARRQPWQEAVCSSLTEMFAPQIHKDRLAGWPDHYPWIQASGLAYFRSRIPLAQRDVDHGMAVTLEHFTTRVQQERALDILQFKLDILWTMLDAIEKAYPE
jgi:pyrroloquinoline-quinone synthase